MVRIEAATAMTAFLAPRRVLRPANNYSFCASPTRRLAGALWALSSRRGASPARERRCSAVGNGLMSPPISAILDGNHAQPRHLLQRSIMRERALPRGFLDGSLHRIGGRVVIRDRTATRQICISVINRTHRCCQLFAHSPGRPNSSSGAAFVAAPRGRRRSRR